MKSEKWSFLLLIIVIFFVNNTRAQGEPRVIHSNGPRGGHEISVEIADGRYIYTHYDHSVTYSQAMRYAELAGDELWQTCVTNDTPGLNAIKTIMRAATSVGLQAPAWTGSNADAGVYLVVSYNRNHTLKFAGLPEGTQLRASIRFEEY